MRETLFELANRDSAGNPALEIKIVPDDDGIIRDDGALAWLLRDFAGARFVNRAEEAAGAQLLLTAYDEGGRTRSSAIMSASVSACAGAGRWRSWASGIGLPGGRKVACGLASHRKKPSCFGCAKMSTMAFQPSGALNSEDVRVTMCK